jgi:hypothetical protein
MGVDFLQLQAMDWVTEGWPQLAESQFISVAGRSMAQVLMRSLLPIRLCLGAVLALPPGAAWARAQGPRYVPPEQFARPPARWVRPAPGGGVLLAQNGGGRLAQNRPGLEQWMQQHRNLPPAEQQRALQSDPSFRALPPQAQQRTLNELRRLQGMNPQELNRRRALLRMTPQQQLQFNATMQQYAALPPGRQQLVGRAFAALRRVPPQDRAAAMSTFPPLRQLSPYERQTLENLLAWEPYMNGAGDPGDGR